MRNWYYTPERVADNRIHAETIRNYWAERGFEAHVKVCERTGEISSDIGPRRLPAVSPHKPHIPPSIKSTADRIEGVVCDEYGVTLAQMRGQSRKAHIVRARHEAWLRMREMTGMSYPGIGRRYGRDHASIIHGCERAKERREAEELA